MAIASCHFLLAKHSVGKSQTNLGLFAMLKINQYFDGKVASIGINTSDLPATVGVMDIGQYEFDTSQHEVMTVINGHLSVLLPSSDEYQDFFDGDQFEVAANSSFKLKVPVQTAYFCTYEDK